MNDFKNITRLYMMATAVSVIHLILQRKRIKKLNDVIHKRGELLDIGKRVIEGENRGLELLERWRTEGKITSEMLNEFVDEIDVDEETKSKIENLD